MDLPKHAAAFLKRLVGKKNSQTPLSAAVHFVDDQTTTVGAPVQTAAPDAVEAKFDSRLSFVEQSLRTFEARASEDRTRLDWALGTLEGIDSFSDAYRNERETAEYNSVFDATEPLISVCIATMNKSESLVDVALHSVLSQTYRNLQIVVVGDCCVDDTPLRTARLHDDRITFVNLSERGPYPPPGFDRWCVAGSNALNHALSLCEGAFITHLDDDDRMTADRVELLLASAKQQRADFLWHAFWYENRDGTWQRIGGPSLERSSVTTGSIFYHRWFAKVQWDVHAYRKGEPGDWQRIRRIKQLRPRAAFVDHALMFHHEEGQRPFFPYDGERFLG